jgi:sugar-specific transcriptional regulator TrmB
MQTHLIKNLESLGFSYKQAQIYLALLEIGKGTVAEIAKKTEVNRTTAYDIVVELENMGLIAPVVQTKKKTYRAEPPEKIPVVLERQAKQLQELAKEAQSTVNMLQTLSAKNPVRPKIKIYEGEQGLKSLYDATLLCKTSIRSFLNAEQLELFDPEYIHGYFERRAKKGIHIQGILGETTESKKYKEKEAELLRDIRLVPKEKMNIAPEVYIYDNTIAIFSIKERLGVSIESSDIATAFRKLYDLAWEGIGCTDRQQS